MTYYYWVDSKRYLVSVESVSARYYFFRSLHELYDDCVCYEDGCSCGKGFFNYCWWECLQSLNTFFPQCVVYVHSREYVNGWRKGMNGYICGKDCFNYCVWEYLQSLNTFFPRCGVHVHTREYVWGWKWRWFVVRWMVWGIIISTCLDEIIYRVTWDCWLRSCDSGFYYLSVL